MAQAAGIKQQQPANQEHCDRNSRGEVDREQPEQRRSRESESAGWFVVIAHVIWHRGSLMLARDA
jgi:hypothetical protein